MSSNALEPIAKALGINPEWLDKLITLESNWKPDAYNSSGAVGLIQFMPKTLKGMGLLSPVVAAAVPFEGQVPEAVKQAVRREFLAKYPTVEAQLQGPVLQYFKGRSYPTEQSVYMQVFYPAYRSAPLSQIFPASVQAQNPGIVSVGDYVDLVNRKVAIKKATLPTLAVLAVGLASYFMLRA